MLRGLAKSLLADAVRRHTGVPQAGAVSTTLITTGASLLLVRGRRPAGLALLAAGGLLRWREIEREKAPEAGVRRSRAAPARDASPATAPR
jgi:hypothetical protein